MKQFNKIKLYHYSNEDIKKSINPIYYGSGAYTSNDVKCTSVKRCFYYLKPIPYEHFFKTVQYLYVTEIQKSRLYDLSEDYRGYIIKDKTITEILNKIKQKYEGVIYKLGNYNVVNLFYSKKFIHCYNLKKGI